MLTAVSSSVGSSSPAPVPGLVSAWISFLVRSGVLIPMLRASAQELPAQRPPSSSLKQARRCDVRASEFYSLQRGLEPHGYSWAIRPNTAPRSRSLYWQCLRHYGEEKQRLSGATEQRGTPAPAPLLAVATCTSHRASRFEEAHHLPRRTVNMFRPHFLRIASMAGCGAWF